MSKAVTTIKEKENIIMDWLDGEDIKSICEKHNVSKTVLNNLLESDTGKEIRTALEGKYQSLVVARENRMAEEIKNDVHEYVRKAIKSYANKPDAIKYIDKVSVMFNTIANNLRLNRGEATERGETVNRNINIDVARLIDELKTPEEKKEFLLNQIKS
jgi:hypothetical protein